MDENFLLMRFLVITFLSLATSGNFISRTSEAGPESASQDSNIYNKKDDDRVMVCYYGSWAVYRPDAGKFDVEDIDPFICTHLIYAFAGLHPSTNEIISLDPWNDLYDNYGKGAYLRFTRLKRFNPSLKTLLAIGGWNEGSSKYSQMAKTSNTRKTFIKSCVDFLHKYGFDGLDFDWEYPTLRGGHPEDKVNFGSLLEEMRLEFDKEDLLMTSAVSAGKLTIDAAYDVKALVRNLDLIHLMAYDFHGTWESYAHHHSPFYAYELDKGDNALLNMDWAVRYWLKIGVPPEKLVVGIGLYGRCFTLTSSAQNTVYSPAPQPGLPGPYTREPGVLGYNEICEQQKGPTTRTEENEDFKENGNQTNRYKEVKNSINTEENIKRGIKRDVFYVERRDFGYSNSNNNNPVSQTSDKNYLNLNMITHDNPSKETGEDTENELRNSPLTNEKQEETEEMDDAEMRDDEDDDAGGWTIVRDQNMISPYAYKERQWCGYDDDKSVALKAEYIVSLGLAGAMVWSIETDDFHGMCNHTQPFPLITTIRTILRDGKPIPTTTSAPTTTTTVDPNVTTTSTTETTTTTTTPTPTPAPSSVCHREGLNADPRGDCSIFYNCHAIDGEWKVYLFHCAPGTIFVESLQICDFPEGHSFKCKIVKGDFIEDNHIQSTSFNKRLRIATLLSVPSGRPRRRFPNSQ